jgi:hypothetical protein
MVWRLAVSFGLFIAQGQIGRAPCCNPLVHFRRHFIGQKDRSATRGSYPDQTDVLHRQIAQAADHGIGTFWQIEPDLAKDRLFPASVFAKRTLLPAIPLNDPVAKNGCLKNRSKLWALSTDDSAQHQHHKG